MNGIATVINRVGATITVDTPGLALGREPRSPTTARSRSNGFVNLNGSTVTNNNVLTITGALTMSGSDHPANTVGDMT